MCFFFFSSRRRHTRSTRDWSSDVCSSDLEVDRHEAQLGEAWREAAAGTRDPAEFERLWLETAHRWSFAEVNHLIDRHNANFPAEARLPMDPRTRDFVRINGKPYQRDPLDEEWILARWPADLAAARRAA